ncbi:MAG: hypothetical protein JXB05_14060 [Myxococcaceae bacterium]|nr:hypothetical protein [Myxococcaceae bacterium]
MEHRAYKLLDLERDRISKWKKPRMLMMRLLAELQQAHIEAVDYAHQNNLKLPTE